MPLHPNVVGRISEDGGGFLSGEQCATGVRIQGIPTEETVVAQGPNVTRSRYGRALSDLKFVLGIPGLVRRLQRLNSQIDLRRLEAGRINLEIERYVRKLFQNNRHFAIIPVRAVGQLVIGQHVGFGLGLRQMVKPDDGDFLKPKQPSRFQSSMASDNSLFAVDQNRGVEAKSFDAVSDRFDLLPRMLSRVNRIWKDQSQRSVLHNGSSRLSRDTFAPASQPAEGFRPQWRFRRHPWDCVIDVRGVGRNLGVASGGSNMGCRGAHSGLLVSAI